MSHTCVQSLCRQARTDLEVVIVDNSGHGPVRRNGTAPGARVIENPRNAGSAICGTPGTLSRGQGSAARFRAEGNAGPRMLWYVFRAHAATVFRAYGAAVAVKTVSFSTALESLALWVTSGTINCKAAAAIQASANVMGRPFFSQPLLILYFASQKPVAANIVDDIFNKYRQR